MGLVVDVHTEVFNAHGFQGDQIIVVYAKIAFGLNAEVARSAQDGQIGGAVKGGNRNVGEGQHLDACDPTRHGERGLRAFAENHIVQDVELLEVTAVVDHAHTGQVYVGNAAAVTPAQ